ncbi:MAG: transcriptional regulator [Candidatus Thermoplasmatota archaeon]|nr:transcriptional regulator [Candidatus Thermoplasmatota archaeon]
MNEKSNLFRKVIEDLEPVKRHVKIIKTLMAEQPVGIIKMSQSTGIPVHKIRYSMRVLEMDGIITPSSEGALLTPEFIDNKNKLVDEAREFLNDIESLYAELRLALIGKK